MQGTIRRVIRGKGFGFIVADERQYFFHHSEVKETPFKRLVPGDVVEFQPLEEEEGLNPRATSVVVIVKKEIVPPISAPAVQGARPDSKAASRTLGERAPRSNSVPADEEEWDDDREFVSESPGGSSSRKSGPRRSRSGGQMRGDRMERRPRAQGTPGDRGEGVIRAIDVKRGFGFIETPAGDIFFHRTSVKGDFESLGVGAHVTFVFGIGDRGSKAEDVAAF